MERLRVLFMYARESAFVSDPDAECAREMRQTQNNSLIQYCTEVDSILFNIPQDNHSMRHAFLDIVQPHIRRMISRCDILSLINRVATREHHMRGILYSEINAHQSWSHATD